MAFISIIEKPVPVTGTSQRRGTTLITGQKSGISRHITLPDAPDYSRGQNVIVSRRFAPENSEAASKRLPPEGFHRPLLSVHGLCIFYFSSSKSFALIGLYQNYPIIILKAHQYCQSFRRRKLSCSCRPCAYTSRNSFRTRRIMMDVLRSIASSGYVSRKPP